MISFSPPLFETLKLRVLECSSIKSITPGDCKALSSLIYSKTKLTISETTLKRVYGFAYSKFRPSLFTIEVMAKYCDFDGWDNFCESQGKLSSKTSNDNVDWKTLSDNASKITSFTLQALKNRSGIPFTQTIKRKFLDDHFDEFLAGDYTATVFTAPSGYGKTIGLCHWIDEKIASGSDDIILFFSSSALMNVFLSGRDLNDWLLALLGYSSQDDISVLFDINKRRDGKFYFIIDGFDEHMFKIDQFQLLLHQLTDIFSFYQSHDWFKLILTMRSSNWINNRHDMEFSNEKWFTGFITDDNLTTNVPLFNIQEIKELCVKINPNIQSSIAIDIANNFNHPLYFQFYYKQHKDDFTFNNVDHICIYDLVSVFILNKVYLGHYATEKLLLLKEMVGQMEFANGVYELNKLKIHDLLKQYNHAYNELISIGFLREVNISSEVQFKTRVQFGNNHFLEYTIAKELLLNNNTKFDLSVINIINDTINDKHKLPVLKWCIMHAVKSGQQESFDLLSHITLSPKEKSELIMFLGDLLQKICSSLHNSDEAVANYFKQDCSDGLFYYFFGLEFVSIDYKNTLGTLLKFNLSNSKKIIAYTGLATIAIMQLDVKKLEEYITRLKTFPQDDFQQFSINPLHCLDAIYQYLKYGVIKKDFFSALTSFYFNPSINNNLNNKANELTFLLAGYSLLILQRPFKILRFINGLKTVHKPGAAASFSYNFFLKALASGAYYFLDNKNEVSGIYNSIALVYKQEENSATAFMKARFYSLKIKLSIMNEDYTAISSYLNALTQVCDESGDKLSKLFVYNVILNNQHLMNLDPQLFKQTAYNLTRLLRECGISPEIFVKPQEAEAVLLKLKFNSDGGSAFIDLL